MSTKVCTNTEKCRLKGVQHEGKKIYSPRHNRAVSVIDGRSKWLRGSFCWSLLRPGSPGFCCSTGALDLQDLGPSFFAFREEGSQSRQQKSLSVLQYLNVSRPLVSKLTRGSKMSTWSSGLPSRVGTSH